MFINVFPRLPRPRKRGTLHGSDALRQGREGEMTTSLTPLQGLQAVSGYRVEDALYVVPGESSNLKSAFQTGDAQHKIT